MYNKKLKQLYYSQNSINTFKSCPLKFKYKYIDNINWKHDDDTNEYYENILMGSDFHLVCERYFSNTLLGIDDDNNKFNTWINKIKDLIPINADYIYLPEYELRYNKDNIKLQAKYDLIIIKNNSIEIWDWKTENKKLNHKNLQNRMQTMVYMFLIKENIKNIFDLNISCENITMNYYQPEYFDNPIIINYNENIHKNFAEKINSFLNDINSFDYNSPESNLKNMQHCKYCEFNNLCNREQVNYFNLFEEEIDEP